MYAKYELVYFLKAALINIRILTMGQMIMCHVKRVTGSVTSTENDHPTLQFTSALVTLKFWFSHSAFINYVSTPCQRNRSDK